MSIIKTLKYKEFFQDLTQNYPKMIYDIQ